MITDKFTVKLQEALADAQSLAVGRDHQLIDSTHIMLALVNQKGGTVRHLLQQSDVNVDWLQSELMKHLNSQPKVFGHEGDVRLSNSSAKLFNRADRLAQKKGDQYISSEIVLLVALEGRELVSQLLRKAGATRELLEQRIEHMRGSQTVDDANEEGQRRALEKYTIDLTRLAEEGRLDPVIGRDDEIRRTIQVLQRRTKNNPVVIGEAGVGKTAIVEGLARRIVDGEVPSGLRHNRLLSLDLGALLAGTSFRGEFEKRMKALLSELAHQGGKIILFIDEMHTLVGAGQAGSSAMDAGNMLKPALARGELHCVGATTLDEYRKYIEKDAALERRFQKIIVQEPSVENTIAMLRGIQEKYEVHHGVNITDPAIIAATRLSHRYITDRNLPDKAIDLIDEAASRIRIEIDSKPEALDRLDRKIIQLKIEREALRSETDPTSQENLKQLEHLLKQQEKEYSELEQIWFSEKAAAMSSHHVREKLDAARLEEVNAQRAGNLEQMARLKNEVIPKLERDLVEAEEEQEFELLRSSVTEEQIAEVVSTMTGIPVSKICEGERHKLLRMEQEIAKRVVGQERAIQAVSDAIRRSRTGLADPNQPTGTFLFLGPTGVGKTELSKALAEFLFDTEEALIRIDMSEFMEKHSVSKLIGSPPGYVGYDDGGYLTELVRRRPYSVILMDEVEKAHIDVFNILLQVLDDGRLTDNQGRTVDFRNTVVIMTSNLGSDLIQKLTETADYEIMRTAVLGVASQHFPPEFVNRIDEMIVFHSLNNDHIRGIAEIMIGYLQQRLSSQDLKLRVSFRAIDQLAELGFDPAYGARPLGRTLQSQIENPLAKEILVGRFLPGDEIQVTWSDGKFQFNHFNNENKSAPAKLRII